MKRTTIGSVRGTTQKLANDQASARIIFLVLVSFLLGIAAGGFWFFQQANHGGSNKASSANASQTPPLSDGTKTLLKSLDSPVELRFYSVLDSATVPDSMRAFTTRVDQMLSAYQQEANGKLTVSRVDSQSPSAPNAAFADGIKPFNLEKGDACYLGLALVYKGQKESLPQLSPEWEPALEADLSRALAKLVEAARPAKPSAAQAKNSADAIEEVKRLIPDLGSVSLEQGTKILREAALQEFKAAASDFATQVKEAQQRLTQAQNDSSDAEQQAAIKQLQQVQADQAERLRQIAAKSKTQIQAFQQLKAAPH